MWLSWKCCAHTSRCCAHTSTRHYAHTPSCMTTWNDMSCAYDGYATSSHATSCFQELVAWHGVGSMILEMPSLTLGMTSLTLEHVGSHLCCLLVPPQPTKCVGGPPHLPPHATKWVGSMTCIRGGLTLELVCRIFLHTCLFMRLRGICLRGGMT